MTEKESRIINKVWPKVASLSITGEDAILAMIRVIYAVLEEEK